MYAWNSGVGWVKSDMLENVKNVRDLILGNLKEPPKRPYSKKISDKPYKTSYHLLI